MAQTGGDFLSKAGYKAIRITPADERYPGHEADP